MAGRAKSTQLGNVTILLSAQQLLSAAAGTLSRSFTLFVPAVTPT
jgi:hypothetical protein